MITQLEGILVEKTPAYAVIDCNGVGYFVHISLHTYPRLVNEKEKCRLYTHLSVREDAQSLYGFADKEERDFFRLLISVSGIGAGTARIVLSSLSPPEISRAILGNDVNAFTSIKGIGAKTAQRIIVDLKDKVGKSPSGRHIFSIGQNTNAKEALMALSALGFSGKSAEKALSDVTKEDGEELSVEQLVKKALKQL